MRSLLTKLLITTLLFMQVNLVAQTIGTDGVNLAETVNNQLAAIANAPESETNATTTTQLQRVKAKLASVQSLRLQTQQYQDTLNSFDSSLAQLQEELDRSKTPHDVPIVTDPDSIDLAYLANLLTQLSEQLETINTDISALQTRQNTIEPEFIASQDQLDALRNTLNNLAAADRVPTNAAYLDILASIELHATNLRKLEAELTSFDSRMTLARHQRELVRTQLSHNQAIYDAVSNQLNNKKQQDAQSVVNQNTQQIEQLDVSNPVVLAAASRNAELADQLSRVFVDVNQIVEQRQHSERDYQQVIESGQAIDEQLSLMGGDSYLGEMLLSQRAAIAQITKRNFNNSNTDKQLNSARRDQLQLNTELLSLDSTLASLLVSVTDDKAAQAALTELIEKQRRLLYERLIDGQKNKIGELTSLSFTKTKLASKSDEILDKIDEQLLWIATNQPIKTRWFSELFMSLKRIPNIASSERLSQGIEAQPQRSLLAGAIFIGLMLWTAISRKRIYRRLQSHGNMVHRLATDKIAYTFEAIILTLLLALRLPMLLALVAYFIKLGNHNTSFEVALAAALTTLSYTWLVLDFIRRIMMKDGLCTTHFRMTPIVAASLERIASLARFIVAPLFAIGSFIRTLADQQLDDTLGRLVFIVTSISLAWFLRRVRGHVISHTKEENQQGWRYQFFFLGFPICYIGLVVLSLGSAIGYHYTAIIVAQNLFMSLLAMAVTLLAYTLMFRWLLVARKHLLWQQLKQRREQTQQVAEQPHTADESLDTSADSSESHIAEINSIQSQALSLVRVACTLLMLMLVFSIWDNASPAVSLFEGVELWSDVHQVDGETVVDSITLLNLIIAIATLMITFAAARNLPGLIEMLALRYLHVDAGARYAAVTLTRYLIILVGVVASFNGMGLSWSKIQWLIAAIGVGLGFGLQEIVANFVGGLVILFERPLRVGDTVTIGEHSGTVTDIRMRTTTVVDWDNKEIVVPNKLFISDSLINWTLSSDVTRLVFRVGVAYGSDTDATLESISEALAAHDEVLTEPPFNVFFIEFGDSALMFEIRCFVAGAVRRLPVTHDLHMDIDRRLRDANIEIAFPQLDVHLKTDQ